MSRSALLAILALPLCAQAPATDSDEPQFRANTQLVQVDVVVHSKGKLVRGLTKDDFQLFDSGKPRQIAVFGVREPQATPPNHIELPAGAVTNRPDIQDRDPVAATVVLIDGQNTFAENLAYARQKAIQYFEKSNRRESIALYALDTTMHVLQNFTADRDALRKAVEKYKPAQSVSLDDPKYGVLAGLKDNAANAARAAATQRQADITTSAFELLARHLSGLPGRKKVIWITAALPLAFTQEYTRNDVTIREFTNLSKQLLSPMSMFNDANVALYPVDPRGVMGFGTDGLMDPGLSTMNQIAAATGGRAFYNDNDMAAILAQAFSDTDITYTLGFYPSEKELDGRVHSITVKMREGGEARYRRSYTAEAEPKPPTDKYKQATLNGWLSQPLEATGIPLVAAAKASGKAGFYDVEVAVDISALRLEQKNGRFVGSFQLVTVPDVGKDPKGVMESVKVNLTPQRMAELATTGMRVRTSVRVTNDKGKLLSPRLHLVVIDAATGKSGSVRIPLTPA